VTEGLKYHEVLPISRDDAEASFASQEDVRIIDALLSLAYHDSDWRWVQNRCLAFRNHRNPSVRRAVALCIFHLARIHQILDEDVVMPVLQTLAEDEEIKAVAGADDVKDLLDEIDSYLGSPRRRWHHA
jgi:hypothetical protein